MTKPVYPRGWVFVSGAHFGLGSSTGKPKIACQFLV